MPTGHRCQPAQEEQERDDEHHSIPERLRFLHNSAKALLEKLRTALGQPEPDHQRSPMKLDEEDPAGGPVNRSCSAEENCARDRKQKADLENKSGNGR